MIMVLEADLTVRYANPAVERVLGYRPEQFVGSRLVYYLPSGGFERLLDGVRREAGNLYDVSTRVKFWMLRADDSKRFLECTIVDLSGDPDIGGIVLYARDVTEHKTLQDDLLRRAFYDSMTGLANRALFINRVEHALDRTVRQSETIGVLFVDLDGFKAVNDSLGHQAGDRVLMVVAQRLQDCLRPADTAARLGGDEFAVLLEDPKDVGGVMRVAHRIEAALRAPLFIDDRVLSVTASVGVTVSCHGRHRAEDLLRAADAAMYEAKATGESRHVAFKGSSLGGHKELDPSETSVRT